MPSADDPAKGREEPTDGNIDTDFQDSSAGLTEELLAEYQQSDGLFRNKELLQISHVVTDDRIVGREEEIEKLVSEVGPAVRGGQPNNVLLFGKTGTGKSLVTRHVTDKVEQMAVNNSVSFQPVYIDCTQVDTETQVIRHSAKKLNEENETEISIPISGPSTSEYYDRLWDILDKLYDVVVLILDEIDKLPPEQGNDVLYELSRAGEGKKTDCKVAVIGISNKINFPNEELDQRTKSSFNPEEYVFDPYDANQLQEILRRRRDAFKEGTLDTAAIQLCAALSAQGHGDARRAIDILRNAGELADRENAEKVKEEHVRQAVERAELDRFRTLLSGMPTQQKTTLYALAKLQKTGEQEQYSTNTVYDAYENIAEEHGKDIRSRWTVRDEYLDELEFLGFTTSEKTSHGRGSPPKLYHSLTESPEIVIQIIEDDIVSDK